MNQILDLHFTTRDVACQTIALHLATDPLGVGSRDKAKMAWKWIFNETRKRIVNETWKRIVKENLETDSQRKL